MPTGAYEPNGLAIDFGNNAATVLAPIAPGIILPVPFEKIRRIPIGETVKVPQTPCLIALDGERELEIQTGSEVSIRLTFEGPVVVDFKAALAAASASGFFRK